MSASSLRESNTLSYRKSTFSPPISFGQETTLFRRRRSTLVIRPQRNMVGCLFPSWSSYAETQQQRKRIWTSLLKTRSPWPSSYPHISSLTSTFPKRQATNTRKPIPIAVNLLCRKTKLPSMPLLVSFSSPNTPYRSLKWLLTRPCPWPLRLIPTLSSIRSRPSPFPFQTKTTHIAMATTVESLTSRPLILYRPPFLHKNTIHFTVFPSIFWYFVSFVFFLHAQEAVFRSNWHLTRQQDGEKKKRHHYNRP